MATHKGRYRPTNPEKYVGDPTNIVYRSSWELKYMRWLDHCPSVLNWASEEKAITYKHPISGRVARYFPDFFVKFKTKAGPIENWVIEIKPKKETRPPEAKKTVTKRYIREVTTYSINHKKWEAATEWCNKRGFKFVVLTEDDLF